MKTTDVRWPAVVLAALALLAVPLTRAQDQAAAEVEYALVKPLASSSLLLDAVAVGGGAAPGLMAAVGERGHVLLSDDDGDTWRQASSVPTRATLTGVWFHDQKLGWAVGHDAVILHTEDGGDTWERQHWAPEEERPFLDVWFQDADNGFAIGAYGYFLVTEDGGDTWEDLGITILEPEAEEEEEVDLYDLGGDFHLNHLATADGGRLYIAAEAGTIYRSDDGGETWLSLPSPYGGSFFGSLPLGGDAVLLFGLRGNLFRSDDAGQTWRPIDTGTVAILNAGVRLADGTVVVAGTAGALLVSRDGGETVSLVERPDRQALAMVLEAGDGLILVGEFGVQKIPLADLEGAP